MGTKGKIVLIPFPFDDLSGTKVRPVVVLTDPVPPHDHVVEAFITSRIPTELLDTDVALDTTDSGFGETGLRVPSAIRLHRLITVSTSLLLRELGRLPRSMEASVDSKFRQLFDLR